jgi:hypothetical protein
VINRPRPHPIFVTAPVVALVAGAVGVAPLQARTWQEIDALRDRLESSGVRVVQGDCPSARLQGLYHAGSDTIVICRVHRTPAQVWDTLAHEAAHRMQQCAGGPITRASHTQMMARTLQRHAPAELRTLQAYPPHQRHAELEARYTAKLSGTQVLQLFDRYCGRQNRPVLTLTPRTR